MYLENYKTDFYKRKEGIIQYTNDPLFKVSEIAKEAVKACEVSEVAKIASKALDNQYGSFINEKTTINHLYRRVVYSCLFSIIMPQRLQSHNLIFSLAFSLIKRLICSFNDGIFGVYQSCFGESNTHSNIELA